MPATKYLHDVAPHLTKTKGLVCGFASLTISHILNTITWLRACLKAVIENLLMLIRHLQWG